jgi:hypothetical protein
VLIERTGAFDDRPSGAPGGAEFSYPGGSPPSFFKYLDRFTVEDLNRKTIITSTVYDDRIDYLKDKGVDVIIDTTPKLLKNVAGVSVLEAMLRVAFEIPRERGSDDELLEIISNMQDGTPHHLSFGKTEAGQSVRLCHSSTKPGLSEKTQTHRRSCRTSPRA